MTTEIRIIPFLRALWQQFKSDTLVVRATGLAYASLLATVPLIAVLFALFTAFAAFDDIKQKVQDLLFSQFLPTHQGEIVAYIEQFTSNTNRLGFVGFIFLIATAILLLDAIEVSFNDIWHVRSRRKPFAKITAYTSVLVFATVFLGSSISISARVRAMLFTHATLELGFVTKLGAWILPVLLTFVAFTVMFVLIPNTKVKLKSAAIGAIVASILWELAKGGFASSIGQSVRYSTIYGSLAAVPIFLIWLYITWLIVLLGLEIAFTHQRYKSLVHDLTADHNTSSYHVALALQVFTMIAERFEGSHEPPSCDDLSDRLEAPFELVEDQLERMGSANLVRKVAGANLNEGWVPATSTDRVRISTVIRSAFQDVSESETMEEPLRREVLAILADFQAAGHETIGDLTVRDLISTAATKRSGEPDEHDEESQEAAIPECE
ncbi:MAG: YihY family inner membrane protein [bacterium]|nr:YihY family inner membrane protein [bacterium]